MPKATVAIPNFNGSLFISEAIESAVHQTEQDIEIVVVDNRSTDNSWDIINKWAQRDNRIKAFRYEKYIAPLPNWNRCVTHTTTDYLYVLHSDDRIRPTSVEKCLRMFEKRPDLGYVFTEKEPIDDAGIATPKTPFYNQSGFIPGLGEARVNILGWHTSPDQMMFRVACMKEAGIYEFNEVHSILMMNLYWDVGYIQEALLEKREHPNSDTSSATRYKIPLLHIYLAKICALHNCLPPEAMELQQLIPNVKHSCAMTSLKTFAFSALGSNQTSLCREYLAMAKGFMLEIEEEPLYQFLKAACEKKNWTLEALTAEWQSIHPPVPGKNAPPYPLPEGSTPVDIDLLE